jgi:hypothetical protein
MRLPFISSMTDKVTRKHAAPTAMNCSRIRVFISVVGCSATVTDKLRTRITKAKAVHAQTKSRSWMLRAPRKLRVGRISEQVMLKTQLRRRFPKSANSMAQQQPVRRVEPDSE